MPIKINNDVYTNICPFCNSKEIEFIGEISYPNNLLFTTTKIELTLIPLLFTCIKCKSGFTNNIINEINVIKLYSQGDSSSRWHDDSTFVEKKPKNMVKFLRKHISKIDKVLDIGANKGELLDFLRNDIGSKTYALELSEISRNKLLKKGHNIYADLADIEPNSIDIICIFDVVEHIQNLNMFLDSLYDKLSEKGKIIILTGNINSFTSVLAKNNWWYLNAPEHIRFPSIGYFKGLNCYKVLDCMQTINSNGYKSTLKAKIKLLIKLPLIKLGFKFKNKYNGLPLLTEDHYILALEKK